MEEELKSRVASEWFAAFDCARIIGKIDFCVCRRTSASQPELMEQSLLWAEAKRGEANPYESIAQLILTIGQARVFNEHLPPPFLGAFDSQKIAFLPYSSVMDIFARNDFNWRVPASNHETREFKELYATVKGTLEKESLVFRFDKDAEALREFIKDNFRDACGVSKIKIDKNNFTAVYAKWRERVMPTIICDWDEFFGMRIIDADFYLADLLSRDNVTIRDKLAVLLESGKYRVSGEALAKGGKSRSLFAEGYFSDGMKAHGEFWRVYERPPAEEYWDYIVERRDLLVPQDIRERKGSFFTPQKWVALSQRYIARALGEDWQEKYVVWDPAAGTGNLLAGLTEKYNIWASTIDKQDVDVMKDRIANGAALLESHVFQFDFLNDSFDRLPEGLRKVVEDIHERKRLVIYMNPPYAEAASARTVAGRGGNKTAVSNETKVHSDYSPIVGKAARELFIQFLIRAHEEMRGCVIANFSKLKGLQSPNFGKFREEFQPKLESLFLIPADTFDNVNGKFPIGFFVWDTDKEEEFKEITADVYNADGARVALKKVRAFCDAPSINQWLKQFSDREGRAVGAMCCVGSDFQHQNYVNISCVDDLKGVGNAKGIARLAITRANLIPACVYFAARLAVPATWLNDRDQFLWPADSWKDDALFQSDCLAYALFSPQNRITCARGANDWIPFTPAEVDARDNFESSFMSDFIAGKARGEAEQVKGELLCAESGGETSRDRGPLEFSDEARAVFDAARALWRLYNAQDRANANSSLYDIRRHFQGVDAKGRLDAQGGSDEYKSRLAALRAALKSLALRIEPKIYEHGFLQK